MAEHRVTCERPTHTAWDAAADPVVQVRPGDTVTFETDDVAGGRIGRRSRADDLLAADVDGSSPLAGPVYVEGAEPGDALVVRVVELRPAAWGWAGIAPGRGLLPREDFPDPYLKLFDLRDGRTTVLAEGVRIPVEPFLGTMGVCPAAARGARVGAAHAGGTIHCRHAVAGATLVLPVCEPGALFSLGAAHAAEGDGDVACTGIECAMTSCLRFDVEKGAAPRAPRLRRPPGPLTPRVDHAGWSATFGVEPDPAAAAQAAVREMVDLLAGERGMGREDAYLLCSLAGDLKITEIAGEPGWIVGCFVPDAVFAG